MSLKGIVLKFGFIKKKVLYLAHFTHNCRVYTWLSVNVKCKTYELTNSKSIKEDLTSSINIKILRYYIFKLNEWVGFKGTTYCADTWNPKLIQRNRLLKHCQKMLHSFCSEVFCTGSDLPYMMFDLFTRPIYM